MFLQLDNESCFQIRRYKASPKIMEKAEKVYNSFKVIFCKVDNDAAVLAQAKKSSEKQKTGMFKSIDSN